MENKKYNSDLQTFSYKTLEFMSTCNKFTRYTRIIQRKTVMFMFASNYDLEHVTS